MDKNEALGLKEGDTIKKYTLGLYEKSMPGYLTWEEKLNCARECGFDTVEISIDETDEKLERLNMSMEERLNLIRDMYKCGIKIRTMCLSAIRKFPLGSLDENNREKGLGIIEKAIDLAEDLGISIIQIPGYDVYYEEGNEETRKYFEENLKKAVEISAKKSIILAFETMETDFMNTIGKVTEYVKAVDSPYLQIYPDSGNVTNGVLNSECTVTEDFKKGSGHIAAVHFKETLPGIYREMTFGTGHVDFEEIIKSSWELGVRKYTAEFWYTGNGDWKEVIKNTKKFFDEKFEKALA